MIGLTSLEIFDKDGQKITVNRNSISCQNESIKKGALMYLFAANHNKKTPDFMWLVNYKPEDLLLNNQQCNNLTIKINFNKFVD